MDVIVCMLARLYYGFRFNNTHSQERVVSVDNSRSVSVGNLVLVYVS